MDTTVRSPTEEQSARPEGLNFTQVAKEYNFDNYEEAMIRWGYPVFDIGVTDEHTLWTKYYKVDINRTFLVRLMQKFGESDHELRYDWDFIECLRTIFLGMRHAVLV